MTPRTPNARLRELAKARRGHDLTLVARDALAYRKALHQIRAAFRVVLSGNAWTKYHGLSAKVVAELDEKVKLVLGDQETP